MHSNDDTHCGCDVQLPRMAVQVVPEQFGEQHAIDPLTVLTLC